MIFISCKFSHPFYYVIKVYKTRLSNYMRESSHNTPPNFKEVKISLISSNLRFSFLGEIIFLMAEIWIIKIILVKTWVKNKNKNKKLSKPSIA